jgi:hypothetical protein
LFEQQIQQQRREDMLIDACLTVAAFLGAYGLRTALVGQPALLVHLALLPIIVPTWAFLLVFFRMRAVGGGLVLASGGGAGTRSGLKPEILAFVRVQCRPSLRYLDGLLALAVTR